MSRANLFGEVDEAQRVAADADDVAVLQHAVGDALVADERPVQSAVLDEHVLVVLADQPRVAARDRRILEGDLAAGVASDAHRALQRDQRGLVSGQEPQVAAGGDRLLRGRGAHGAAWSSRLLKSGSREAKDFPL